MEPLDDAPLVAIADCSAADVPRAGEAWNNEMPTRRRNGTRRTAPRAGSSSVIRSSGSGTASATCDRAASGTGRSFPRREPSCVYVALAWAGLRGHYPHAVSLGVALQAVVLDEAVELVEPRRVERERQVGSRHHEATVERADELGRVDLVAPHVSALPCAPDDTERAPRGARRLESVRSAGQPRDEIRTKRHVGMDERPPDGAVDPQEDVVERGDVGRRARSPSFTRSKRLRRLLERVERRSATRWSPRPREWWISRSERDARGLRHASRVEACCEYHRRREGADRQLLLPARRRRRRPAAAQARAVPARDGDRDARPRARRPALAAPRRRAPHADAGVGAPRALRRRQRRQAERGAGRHGGDRASAHAGAARSCGASSCPTRTRPGP